MVVRWSWMSVLKNIRFFMLTIQSLQWPPYTFAWSKPESIECSKHPRCRRLWCQWDFKMRDVLLYRIDTEYTFKSVILVWQGYGNWRRVKVEHWYYIPFTRNVETYPYKFLLQCVFSYIINLIVKLIVFWKISLIFSTCWIITLIFA